MRSPMNMILPALAMALLCAWTSVAQAQWQWRDKSGRITASDLPPPKDIVDKDILVRPSARRAVVVAAAPASAVVASAGVPAPLVKSPLEREVEAKKQSNELEKAAKTKAEEERMGEQRAENCRRARGHQLALDTGQRIARVNDKGEREVLDDKGRADESRRAREIIASDCK